MQKIVIILFLTITPVLFSLYVINFYYQNNIKKNIPLVKEFEKTLIKKDINNFLKEKIDDQKKDDIFVKNDENIDNAVIKNKQVKVNILETNKEDKKKKVILQEEEKKEKEQEPKCVYNQAYQENYEPDSISDILKNAKNCYVLIDPFLDKAFSKILDIKEKGNEVGCYMSVGTGEDWRDDFGKVKPYLAKKVWDDWEGEYFVSIISTELKKVMKDRISKFSSFGCGWVEFDNMDWGSDDEYKKKYGLEISQQKTEEYVIELCKYTKSLGMKCMAKSTTYGNNIFDGLTVESYIDDLNWWNNQEMKNILAKDKIGIVVHYNEKDCEKRFNYYKNIYGNKVSFICENKKLKKYQH